MTSNPDAILDHIRAQIASQPALTPAGMQVFLLLRILDELGEMKAELEMLAETRE